MVIILGRDVAGNGLKVPRKKDMTKYRSWSNRDPSENEE